MFLELLAIGFVMEWIGVYLVFSRFMKSVEFLRGCSEIRVSEDAWEHARCRNGVLKDTVVCFADRFPLLYCKQL